MYRRGIAMTGSRNEEGENLAHYLCRIGDASHLMFLHDLINDGNRHCLLEYNEKQQQCVHIVAMEPLDAVEKMKLLALWGADLNAKELNNGDTPLHIAVKIRNYELVEWLCQQPNINREAMNKECMTPYHFAFVNKDQKMMDLLKKNGAKCKIPLQSESNSADEDYEPQNKSVKHM
ncbi:NF-kappa-B inhibitor cactus-like [Cydia pomonella]|uniref:NF-kappa-B inhibitor cactus-like n=1 Tax=Cydia pomonella TaxID=82600 RepID=UPI002ADE469C|nr:NF-kappa-B inhibitor cactus-like [Cydia pomonella]